MKKILAFILLAVVCTGLQAQTFKTEKLKTNEVAGLDSVKVTFTDPIKVDTIYLNGDTLTCAYVSDDQDTIIIANSDTIVFTNQFTAHQYYAAGAEDGINITNNGDGTVTVDTAIVWLYKNADYTGYLGRYTLPEKTFTLTAQTVNYVIANYNSGAPEMQITTNLELVKESTIIPLFTIFTDGINYRYLSWCGLHDGLINKMHLKNVKVDRFQKESGLFLSDSADNHFTVSAGIIWYGVRDIDFPYYSSYRDTVSQFYHSAGEWTKEDLPTYNNTYYNNGTNRVELTPNGYAVSWVYKIVAENDSTAMGILYGTGDYTLSQAEDATPPPSKPYVLEAGGYLIAKIICKKGQTTATQVTLYSGEVVVSAGTAVAEHNALYNIQGGATDEYYHMTEDEYNNNVYENDLQGLRDSTSALYDTAALHLDTLQAHNERLKEVEAFTEVDPIYSADSATIVHFDDIQVVKTSYFTKSQGYDTIYFDSAFDDADYVLEADGFIDALTNVEIYVTDVDSSYFVAYSSVDCTMQYMAIGTSEATTTNDWYGVQWDITSSNPDVTRIASDMTLHASLPVQNNIRACVMNNDGTVNYYIDPDDWTHNADGDTAILDGSDGMVMIEIPEHWYRWEMEGNIRRRKIAAHYVRGFEYQRAVYVSAFEAAINRNTNTLASVMSDSTIYRGGNNNSAWDGQDNTLLGRPATRISRTNFRTYAQNRGEGWQMYTYEAHNVIWWLYVIEYATRNSQKAVDNTLTAQGYKKGGLGDGVTTAVSSEWSAFSGYYPFIPCGASNSLGTHSGEYSYTVDNFGGDGVDRTFKVNRYHGIEMPFGHIWKNVDGILTVMESDAAGGRTRVYITDKNYSDSDTTQMTYLGDLPRINGYVTDVQDNSFMPLSLTGGSSSKYYCDYSYQSNLPSSGIFYRSLLVGGLALYGSNAGFGFSYSSASPSYAYVNIGVRLCFFEN